MKINEKPDENAPIYIYSDPSACTLIEVISLTACICMWNALNSFLVFVNDEFLQLLYSIFSCGVLSAAEILRNNFWHFKIRFLCTSFLACRALLAVVSSGNIESGGMRFLIQTFCLIKSNIRSLFSCHWLMFAWDEVKVLAESALRVMFSKLSACHIAYCSVNKWLADRELYYWTGKLNKYWYLDRKSLISSVLVSALCFCKREGCLE